MRRLIFFPSSSLVSCFERHEIR